MFKQNNRVSNNGKLGRKKIYINGGKTLMKKLFSYNVDIDKNAYMNWRTSKHEPIQNMNVIAEGYFRSAILLVKQCLADNDDKKADSVIFPMIFAVNHAIELYEKSICWSLNILLGYNTKFNANHDIRGNWLTAKEKIKEFGFGYGREKDEFEKMIICLESYIDEISKNIMDDDINKAHFNIDFSRYPLNKRNEYHFYLKTYDNVVVDLENFLNMVVDIEDCIGNLAAYYYELVVASWQQEQI
jgi:hypothetical protein